MILTMAMLILLIIGIYMVLYSVYSNHSPFIQLLIGIMLMVLSTSGLLHRNNTKYTNNTIKTLSYNIPITFIEERYNGDIVIYGIDASNNNTKIEFPAPKSLPDLLLFTTKEQVIKKFNITVTTLIRSNTYNTTTYDMVRLQNE